jgi:2-methylisocitrate lyase-like PEP mutase family enzyme
VVKSHGGSSPLLGTKSRSHSDGGKVTTASARQAFRALHRAGCFVLANAWDLGSLRRIERTGFAAVATTSAGLAWSLGREDYGLTRDLVLDHLRTIAAATDLPVNADFENGFADDPEEVAANALLAAQTGVAGLSIEDRKGETLYDAALATERIRAARFALDAGAPDVLLVARSEGFLVGDTDIRRTVARLVAFAEAGADCLYAPGIAEPADIREVVAAVHPKPVNVLLRAPPMRVADLAALGVRRVSVGSRLAAAAWQGFDAALKELHDAGTLPRRLFG